MASVPGPGILPEEEEDIDITGQDVQHIPQMETDIPFLFFVTPSGANPDDRVDHPGPQNGSAGPATNQNGTRHAQNSGQLRKGAPTAAGAPAAGPVRRAKPPPPRAPGKQPAADKPSQEPLTKRRKIEDELRQGLQPVAIARSGAGAGGGGGAKGQPVRRPKPSKSRLELDPSKIVPRNLPTAPPHPSAARKPLAPPPPVAAVPSEPKAAPQLAPGEALDAWLAENTVEATEEELIEELPEEAPQERPTAETLAAEAACLHLQSLLPRLTAGRESIGQATTAAMRVGAGAGAARAVRMVIDATAAAAAPRDRLPYLYLLDSAIKAELKNCSSPEHEEGMNGAPQQAQQQRPFARAVGAALVRLVELLLGDEDIADKVGRLLSIWRRERVVPEGLLAPAEEALAAEAARRAGGPADQDFNSHLDFLKRTVPMSAHMRLIYTMPVSQSDPYFLSFYRLERTAARSLPHFLTFFICF
jgi:hypothetical protein